MRERERMGEDSFPGAQRAPVNESSLSMTARSERKTKASSNTSMH